MGIYDSLQKIKYPKGSFGTSTTHRGQPTPIQTAKATPEFITPQEARNFIIAYPDDGTRNETVGKGIIVIDFWEGEVHLPDGSKVTLKNNLKNSKQDFIRSMAVFGSVEMKATLGTNNPLQIFTDVFDWTIFENLEVQQATFEITFTGTPDENHFQIIASSSRKSVYSGRG